MVNETILAIDIGSTKIISIVVNKNQQSNIILHGVGISSSEGVKKGGIVDIDKLSSSLNESIQKATSTTPFSIDKVYVSISSINTKIINNSGSINIQSGIITQKDINQVLTLAYFDAVLPDYDIIHVIPKYFTIDDNQVVENPLNMNGTRLGCEVNIVIAKRNIINNINQVLKRNNIDNTIFVVSSYAASLAIFDRLSIEQKNGNILIFNLGGETSEVALLKKGVLSYIAAVGFGSANITYDLHKVFQTPISAADKIKKDYGSLLPQSYEIKKVKTPNIANSDVSKEILIEEIRTNIHARVEEILIMLFKKISHGGYLDDVNNIVLTGGMSKIKGIDILVNKVFSLPTKILKPVNIQNGYINLEDEVFSVITGMIFFALNQNPPLELDSTKKLRQKYQIQQNEESLLNIQNNQVDKHNKNDIVLNEKENINHEEIKNESKEKLSNKIIKKISQWLGI